MPKSFSMKALFLLPLVFFTPEALAAKKVDLKPVPKVEKQGLFLSNSKALQKFDSGLRVQTDCVDAKGFSYRKGEAGFDSCASNISKPNAMPNEQDRKRGSIGISIGR